MADPLVSGSEKTGVRDHFLVRVDIGAVASLHDHEVNCGRGAPEELRRLVAIRAGDGDRDTFLAGGTGRAAGQTWSAGGSHGPRRTDCLMRASASRRPHTRTRAPLLQRPLGPLRRAPIDSSFQIPFLPAKSCVPGRGARRDFVPSASATKVVGQVRLGKARHRSAAPNLAEVGHTADVPCVVKNLAASVIMNHA